MQQRRFNRLTNAFSKKLENHAAAVALYVAHYNLCRVHEALRITPTMQLGVTNRIWTIGDRWTLRRRESCLSRSAAAFKDSARLMEELSDSNDSRNCNFTKWLILL